MIHRTYIYLGVLSFLGLVGLGCGKTVSESPQAAGGAGGGGSESAAGGESGDGCEHPRFEDPALDQAVRVRLNVGKDAVLTRAQMEKFTDSFTVSQVNSLEGIQCMRKLQDLAVQASPGLTDLSPLSSMTSLLSLEVSDCPVTSLEPLRGLTQLVVLDVIGTKVEDISVLAGLFSLSVISLSESPVQDLSPLASLPELSTVNVSGSNVTRLSGVPKPRSMSGPECLTARDLPLASADIAADAEALCKMGWIVEWSTTSGDQGQCNNLASCYK